MSRKTLGKDDEINIFYNHGLYLPTRTIIVDSVQVDPEHGESGVDAQMSSRLEKALCILEKLPPMGEQSDAINIIMNNPGGDMYHAFAMYDRIRASPRHIVIEGTGQVMSAGSVIFQAADMRRIHKHATMMIHMPRTYGGGITGHTKDLQVTVKEYERVQDWMYAIYLERLRQKDPKFSRRRLKEMMAFDRYITAEEAVKLGLADEIIPHTTL